MHLVSGLFGFKSASRVDEAVYAQDMANESNTKFLENTNSTSLDRYIKQSMEEHGIGSELSLKITEKSYFRALCGRKGGQGYGVSFCSWNRGLSIDQDLLKDLRLTSLFIHREIIHIKNNNPLRVAVLGTVAFAVTAIAITVLFQSVVLAVGVAFLVEILATAKLAQAYELRAEKQACRALMDMSLHEDDYSYKKDRMTEAALAMHAAAESLTSSQKIALERRDQSLLNKLLFNAEGDCRLHFWAPSGAQRIAVLNQEAKDAENRANRIAK